jgi:S-adenosylmethionine:tRNA ribosyltransferase-isomerase
MDLLLSSYQYELPEELIAQEPVTPRDRSRLLVVTNNQNIQHQHFYELGNFLQRGDLLVFNNTRVIPARIYGYKESGGKVEVLLIEQVNSNSWLALVKPGRKLKVGDRIIFPSKIGGENQELIAKIIDRDRLTGGRILQFNLPANTHLLEILDNFGEIPLPPYITDSNSTPEQYQTIYAKIPGAVAAPTAGLHFTTELLENLTKQGINQAEVTLHVGVGTFRPVEVENITEHQMHSEWLTVPIETIEKIKETKARGGRVIAVGTTAVRSLETAGQNGKLETFTGKTNIFIYPGYQWQVVDGLITNFHLPGSSLMMLVSALIGRENLLNIYQEAIKEKYRFYSFGDAMLLMGFIGND